MARHISELLLIKKRQIIYFCQLIRRNNVHRLILKGPLDGRIARGRLRTELMTDIKEWRGVVRLAQSGSMEDHNLLKKTALDGGDDEHVEIVFDGASFRSKSCLLF